MDTLKKPETMLGLFNTAALLGAAIYFRRELNELKKELNEQSEHLSSTVNKVKEMQVTKQHIKQLADVVRGLNTKMSTHNIDINYLRNLSSFQIQQIKEIQENTNEEGEYKLTNIPFQPQHRFHQPGLNHFQGHRQQHVQQHGQQQFNQVGMNHSNFNQPRYNQPGMGQPNYMSSPQQQYGQPNRQPVGYSQNSGSSLIDLGGETTNNYDDIPEDDLDSQINAVRRARNQNGNVLDMSGLGL